MQVTRREPALLPANMDVAPVVCCPSRLLSTAAMLLQEAPAGQPGLCLWCLGCAGSGVSPGSGGLSAGGAGLPRSNLSCQGRAGLHGVPAQGECSALVSGGVPLPFI